MVDRQSIFAQGRHLNRKRRREEGIKEMNTTPFMKISLSGWLESLILRNGLPATPANGKSRCRKRDVHWEETRH